MTGPPGEEIFAALAGHGLVLLGFLTLSVSIAPYSFSNHTQSIIFKITAILGYLIGILLYICMLKSQFMDPGVLFREFSYEDEETGFPSEKNQNKNENSLAANDKIRQGAHIYKPRYCHTCHIMKPPKASH